MRAASAQPAQKRTHGSTNRYPYTGIATIGRGA